MKGPQWKIFLIFISTICSISMVESLPGFALPGSWSDSRGKLIQAHAPGIIQVNGIYFMHGENKTSGATFQSIPCYSSKDLVIWDFVADALTLQKAGDLGPNRIVERPKVIYNDKNKMFVMYMHIDSGDYKEAKFGVAHSKSVCGPYTYLGSQRPFGNLSRDLGLYKDDDGKAYLMSEDRNNGLQIYRLSEDYLDLEGDSAIVTFRNHDFEAPAMFKHWGIYYIIGSHLTGWDTNNNKYSIATSIEGPWSSWYDFTPTGSRTFDSQTTFVLPINGTKQKTFVYMSDRWFSNDLSHSQYIWLPMDVSKGKMKVRWEGSWNLDVQTGEYRRGREEYFQAESGVNEWAECNSVAEDKSFMDGFAITLCPHEGSVGFPVEVEKSELYTVRIRYTSVNETTATVLTNAGSFNLVLPPTTVPSAASVQVKLISGKSVITVASTKTAISLDSISILKF